MKYKINGLEYKWLGDNYHRKVLVLSNEDGYNYSTDIGSYQVGDDYVIISYGYNEISLPSGTVWVYDGEDERYYLPGEEYEEPTASGSYIEILDEDDIEHERYEIQTHYEVLAKGKAGDVLISEQLEVE